MVASSLQDDLLGIPGVEGAEIDGSQDAPAGLRIRISEDADQKAVGGAIRSVLSSHGLGTDTQLPGERKTETQPESEQGSVALLTADVAEPPADDDIEPEETAVIDLTDKGQEARASLAVDETEASEQAQASVAPGSWQHDDVPPFVTPRRPVMEQEEAKQEAPVPPLEGIARIDSVAVVEGRTGIAVTVRASDDTEVSQVASSSEGGVEAAVVKAAAKLVNPASPDPIIVEVEDRRVDGVDIVMIVLDVDGELVAGSAIVAAGRAFALGRATWAALAL